MARKSRKNIETVSTHTGNVTEVLEGAAAYRHPSDDSGIISAGTKSPDAMKAAVYARLSVEDDITMDSLDTQIRLIRDFIDGRDDIVYEDTYYDNGYSGTNFNRPAFNRMMEDLRKGKIQCIVVKDLSRFGRNYLEADYYIETILPFLGARLLAVTDDFDSFRPEDMNSLLVPVKNLVNTMYSKDLSKKIWATSQRKKKEGELLGNGCVYGYIKNQETGKLEIDPMTAVNVQMIFQWKLLGLSTCRIAENLTLMGAPTPRQRQKELGILKKEPGSKWETASISSILKSEYYIGNTVTNKTSTKIFEGKEKRRTDPSEWIITENTHEAIIAKDDFEAIQKSMNEKAEKRAASLEATAKINEKYPDQLKGLLFCGKCGKRMIIDRLPHGAVSSVKTVVYVCRQRGQGRSNNCSGHSISENLLKMLIMERISRTAKECCDAAELWNKTEAMRGRDNPVNKVKAEIQKVTAHLNGISDKRSTLYENLSNGVIDRDEFRLLQDNYKRQHEDGEKELKALEDKLSEIEEAAKQYLNSAEALKKYVSCRAFDEDIVRELVERVDVFPDKHIHVTFRFKNPFEKEGSKDDSSV